MKSTPSIDSHYKLALAKLQTAPFPNHAPGGLGAFAQDQGRGAGQVFEAVGGGLKPPFLSTVTAQRGPPVRVSRCAGGVGPPRRRKALHGALSHVKCLCDLLNCRRAIWPIWMLATFEPLQLGRDHGPLRRPHLARMSARAHKHPMSEIPELDDAKLMLGAAAIVLGPDHAATQALARAVTTRKPADIVASRLALRTVSRDQRRAIADTVEAAWEAEVV